MSIRIRILASAAGVAALILASAVPAKNWDDWDSPANIETLAGSSSSINSPAVDGCASISPDGLTLVFNSNRSGNFELYMASRLSTSDGFGAPVVLPAPVNSPANESCATMAGGHRLYFASDRDDPAFDLYVTVLGQDGWSVPVNLGPNINVEGMVEEAPDIFEDEEGREVMIFTRRQGPLGKIYQSINGEPATLVQGGPHSSASDARASITSDGLAIFWDSTRTGTLGGPDLYYATRSSTSQPFGTAFHLGDLSSAAFDARPFISKDGSILIFASGRTGSETAAPDIWFTTRGKLTGGGN